MIYIYVIVKESTRIKEKYYIPNGDFYVDEDYTRMDEPVLFEQKKKRETTEKTRYILPNSDCPPHSHHYHEAVENSTYTSPTYDDSRQYQHWRYDENDQPDISYYEYPYGLPDAKFAQREIVVNPKLVTYPTEPYDAVGAMLYEGDKGKLHASYFDPIGNGYAEYPIREKIITPTKYKESRYRHRRYGSRERYQSLTPAIYAGDDVTTYHDLHDSEYSPRRCEGIPTVEIKVEASDYPRRVTHHDKDKKSKNYTKFVEGIGYRKYETGVKMKEKSSKFTEEYSPEITYTETSHPDLVADNNDLHPHHDNYRLLQDSYQANGYASNDGTARYTPGIRHHGGHMDDDDYAKQMTASNIHQPRTKQQRPMTARNYRPSSLHAGDADNIWCYSDRLVHPENDYYDRGVIEKVPMHVSFAPTPDVLRPTPPDYRTNPSISARLSAASTTSTYKDQYKNPHSYDARFESRVDHKVLSRCLETITASFGRFPTIFQSSLTASTS